jgi:hypothetical protein
MLNHHRSQELVVGLTPVLTVLDYLAGFSDNLLSNVVVKVGSLVNLAVQLPKELHLDDTELILLELHIGTEFIRLCKRLDLLNAFHMHQVLVDGMGALVQTLLYCPF